MKTKFSLRSAGIILLTLTILLTNCSGDPQKKEEAKLKELVRSYDSLLVTAAKTGDLNPLSKIAARNILQKLRIWIDAWRDSDLYMDASLKNLEFRNVVISEKQARVLVTEEWDYDYKHLNDNKVMLPRSHVRYEMEYIAGKVKKNGDEDWIINAINVKSQQSEKISNEGKS